MKTKLLILATLLLAVFAIALPSCDKDEPTPTSPRVEDFVGKWKLQGFWKGGAQVSMEISFLESPSNYTLDLKATPLTEAPEGIFSFSEFPFPSFLDFSSYIASGRTVANGYWLAYALAPGGHIEFRRGLSSEAGELPSGVLYDTALLKVSHYRLANNTLDLYYSDTEHMRFVRIQTDSN